MSCTVLCPDSSIVLCTLLTGSLPSRPKPHQSNLGLHSAAPEYCPAICLLGDRADKQSCICLLHVSFIFMLCLCPPSLKFSELVGHGHDGECCQPDRIYNHLGRLLWEEGFLIVFTKMRRPTELVPTVGSTNPWTENPGSGSLGSCHCDVS